MNAAYPLVLLLQSARVDTVSPFQGESYGWLALQTVFYLGLVCLAIWFGLRYLLPKMFGRRSAGRGPLSMIDQMQIGPGRSVCIVQAAGRFYLVGVAEKGVQLLQELDEGDVKRYYPDAAKESE